MIKYFCDNCEDELKDLYSDKFTITIEKPEVCDWRTDVSGTYHLCSFCARQLYSVYLNAEVSHE